MIDTQSNSNRHYDRIDVALPVRLFLPDDQGQELRFEAFAKSRNICPGGVFVESTFLLKPDVELWIELGLPDEPLVVECRVAHRVQLDNREYPSGMGIQFLNMDAAAREQLLRYFSPVRYITFRNDLIEEFPHLGPNLDQGTITLLLNLWEEWKIRQAGGTLLTNIGPPAPTPLERG